MPQHPFPSSEHSLYDNDLIFNDDVFDAMSDGFIDTCLHLVVRSGSLSFRMGTNVFSTQENDCIIAPNRTFINDIQISADFSMTSVIVSSRLMRLSLPKVSYEMKGMLSMMSNPVMRLTAPEAALILADFEQVRWRHRDYGHLYYADMVVRSLEVMVLDMYDIHSRYYPEDTEGVGQSAKVLRQFVALLREGLYQSHRQVEYYASRLCISPQYLSECCVKSSGRNASFYIDHFTGEEIARLLKQDDLSITEIAYRFTLIRQIISRAT